MLVPVPRPLTRSTGNFLFAHSLLLAEPAIISPHLLLATAYDTLEVAQAKYPDLMEHVDAIKAAGVRVVFGVDGTNLAKCREVKDGAGSAGWDKVVFNFPHVGAFPSPVLRGGLGADLGCVRQDSASRTRTATSCAISTPLRSF